MIEEFPANSCPSYSTRTLIALGMLLQETAYVYTGRNDQCLFDHVLIVDRLGHSFSRTSNEFKK